jgi:hypothetical protein
MASSAEAGRDQPWDQSPLDGIGTRLQIKGDDSLVSPPCSPFMPLRFLPPIPFQKRSSLLKKSLDSGSATFERLPPLHSARKSYGNLGIETHSGRDVGPGEPFFNRLGRYRNPSQNTETVLRDGSGGCSVTGT